MNLKIFFVIISIIVEITAYIPYLKDIFARKTKSHVYTWLIWIITQATALAGIWYGGGSWGALSLAVGIFFSTLIFLFSLKYGTKNITKSDTIILIAALLAIIIWWQFNQPVISAIMVSVIDVIGYFPSYRKSWNEPWSETLFSWFAFVVSNIFALLALKEYNLLTTTYLVSIALANICFFQLCFIRRKYISKPKDIVK